MLFMKENQHEIYDSNDWIWSKIYTKNSIIIMGSVVGYINGYLETIHILKLLSEPLIGTMLI